MVVVILVLVILMYILILLGLTIWFEKYHLYKATYFHQAPTKTEQIDHPEPSRQTSDPQTVVHPEPNHRRHHRRRVKRGVRGRKNKRK
jgi:hypothetical protein